MDLFDLLCPEARDDTFRLCLLSYGSTPWRIAAWGGCGPLDDIKTAAERELGPLDFKEPPSGMTAERVGPHFWESRSNVVVIYGTQSGVPHLVAHLPAGVAWQPPRGIYSSGGGSDDAPAEGSTLLAGNGTAMEEGCGPRRAGNPRDR